MRIFLDECLSPNIALKLRAEGRDALHPRNDGGAGCSDRRVLERCRSNGYILFTANGRDFRKLIGADGEHFGLVTLPSVPREKMEFLIRKAISGIENHGGEICMINHALDMDADGAMFHYPLPR